MNKIKMYNVEKEIDTMKKGGIILYPTDTVWGIGCDATNEMAVRKIYDLKRRESSKSMIILVSGEEMLREYVRVSEEVLEFLRSQERATTVIYEKCKGLAHNVISEDGSVGVRMPKDDWCVKMIKEFGKPIVSTSANVSGEATASFFGEISPLIKSGVDYISTWRREDETRREASQIVRVEGGKVEWVRR